MTKEDEGGRAAARRRSAVHGGCNPRGTQEDAGAEASGPPPSWPRIPVSGLLEASPGPAGVTRSLTGAAWTRVLSSEVGTEPDATAAASRPLNSKVLREGTHLPLHLCHKDTTSNAETIKVSLKD